MAHVLLTGITKRKARPCLSRGQRLIMTPKPRAGARPCAPSTRPPLIRRVCLSVCQAARLSRHFRHLIIQRFCHSMQCHLAVSHAILSFIIPSSGYLESPLLYALLPLFNLMPRFRFLIFKRSNDYESKQLVVRVFVILLKSAR